MVTHKAIATAAGTAYSQAVEKGQLRTKESRPERAQQISTTMRAAQPRREQTRRRTVTDSSVPAALERLRRFDCDFYAAQNKHTYTSEDSFMPVLRKVHNRVRQKTRLLLASQRRFDLFQAVDVFLQAGDMILHLNKG